MVELLLVVVLLEVEVELEVEPELEVEVELDAEVEVLLEDVLLEVVLVDVGVLVVVLLVVVELGEVVVELEVGVQDSLSLRNGPLIGSCIAEAGVPAGTSTLNVFVTPPVRVTVTVQASADAVGSAASDKPPNIAAVSASKPRSLRLISNVGYFSHKP